MSEMFAPADPWRDGVGGYYEDKDRIRENSTRLVTVLVNVDTDGGGEIVHDEVLQLDCAFIERPSSPHSMVIDTDDLEAMEGFWPRVTGFVQGWQRTTKGLYVGAYVAFTIDFPVGFDEELASTLHIEHTFTFMGNAMKRLPDYLLDD